MITTGEGVVNGYVFQVASQASTPPPRRRSRTTSAGSPGPRVVGLHKEDWAKVWAEETGLSEDITLQALKKREIELVPITDEVIASEQEMADAFAENELLPGKFDVAPFFSDEFNSDTTGK